MTVRDRDTLYKYFKAGELPTEHHFHDLIESTLNMRDEGFRKTPDHGLEISTSVGAHALLTFFRTESARQPLWTVRYGDKVESQGENTGDKLELRAVRPVDEPGASTNALMTLYRAGQVGINTRQAPRHTLQVEGVVGSVGRAGTFPLPLPDTPPKPDGKWHPLTPRLKGCVAFEIVATASGPAGQGRQAMLHAVAVNAHNARLDWFYRGPTDGRIRRWLDERLNRWFNRRNRIRSHDAWFGDPCDRLELQWQRFPGDDPRSYRLMIRTQCDYESHEPIQVHVTRLWPLADPAGAAA